MLELSDDQKLQILLVGAPILSLIGTWMSLRTYGRLKQRAADRQPRAPVQEERGEESLSS